MHFNELWFLFLVDLASSQLVLILHLMKNRRLFYFLWLVFAGVLKWVGVSSPLVTYDTGAVRLLPPTKMFEVSIPSLSDSSWWR